VRGEEFNPAEAITFSSGHDDHASMVLMPPLVRAYKECAANVKVDATALERPAYEDVAADE